MQPIWSNWGRTIMCCSALEWDWPVIFIFLRWLPCEYCTGAPLWTFNQNRSSSEDMWENTLWLSSQEKSIACRGLGKVSSPLKFMQRAVQCSSRGNGETSCWCFQQANSSLPGHLDIWFQKLPPVKPACVFIEGGRIGNDTQYISSDPWYV